MTKAQKGRAEIVVEQSRSTSLRGSSVNDLQTRLFGPPSRGREVRKEKEGGFVDGKREELPNRRPYICALVWHKETEHLASGRLAAGVSCLYQPRGRGGISKGAIRTRPIQLYMLQLRRHIYNAIGFTDVNLRPQSSFVAGRAKSAHRSRSIVQSMVLSWMMLILMLWRVKFMMLLLI